MQILKTPATATRFGSVVLVQHPHATTLCVIKDNAGEAYLAKATAGHHFSPEKDLFELPGLDGQKQTIQALSNPEHRLTAASALNLLGVVQALRSTSAQAHTPEGTHVNLNDLFGGKGRPDLTRLKDQLIQFFAKQNTPQFRPPNVIAPHEALEVFRFSPQGQVK